MPIEVAPGESHFYAGEVVVVDLLAGRPNDDSGIQPGHARARHRQRLAPRRGGRERAEPIFVIGFGLARRLSARGQAVRAGGTMLHVADDKGDVVLSGQQILGQRERAAGDEALVPGFAFGQCRECFRRLDAPPRPRRDIAGVKCQRGPVIDHARGGPAGGEDGGFLARQRLVDAGGIVVVERHRTDRGRRPGMQRGEVVVILLPRAERQRGVRDGLEGNVGPRR